MNYKDVIISEAKELGTRSSQGAEENSIAWGLNPRLLKKGFQFPSPHRLPKGTVTNPHLPVREKVRGKYTRLMKAHPPSK
jgi:hypothetical protein